MKILLELEKILLENYEQLKSGELAGLNQQFLIAQGNVFKQTQQLVDKNKNNQTTRSQIECFIQPRSICLVSRIFTMFRHFLTMLRLIVNCANEFKN